MNRYQNRSSLWQPTVIISLLFFSGLFVKDNSSGVDFDKDRFVASHEDEPHRRFAEQIVTVQMFEQFTQRKCHNLNSRAANASMDPFEIKLKTLPDLKNKYNDIKVFAKSSQVLFSKMVDKESGLAFIFLYYFLIWF